MGLTRSSAGRRICDLGSLRADDGALGVLLDRARTLGFDTVLVAATAQADAGLTALAEQAEARSLALYGTLSLQHLVAQHSDAFSVADGQTGQAAADPRWSGSQAHRPPLVLDGPATETAIALAVEEIGRWAALGLTGVLGLQAHGAPAAVWKAIVDAVRKAAPEFVFIADTHAAPRGAVLGLAGCGFDFLLSSLCWWDRRARWFVEEYEALRSVAPLMADLTPIGPDASGCAETGDGQLAYAQRLVLAAATGCGLLVSPEADASSDLAGAVQAANALSRELSRFDGEMRFLSGEGAAVAVLLRADASDVRRSREALLLLINPDPASSAAPAMTDLLSRAGAEFGPWSRLDGEGDPFGVLAAGEARLLVASRVSAIRQMAVDGAASARVAAQAPRLVVEAVTPTTGDGSYPVRRVVGETLRVEADVFGDGHEQLAAELQWRPLDQPGWSAVPMRALENDRWEASFPLQRMGRYAFRVEAWLDVYGGFRRDYAKKRAAGVAQPVDTQEGCAFVRFAAERCSAELKTDLGAVLVRLETASDDEARGDILMRDDVAGLMREADDRPYRLQSSVQLVDAERLQAQFASWYELFPRSQTLHPARHGTLEDVIARLPAVRAMGFDVLYFPPIHPIGAKNRKGRNNSLTPSPDDPGSPYAIGSDEGGHDAIHPALGGFADFRRLVAAAAGQGLEIALDFAVQCSPDHPWLKQHPGWFDWRPDGSIKYAENPPKKYQDIVNVDFYKPDAVPSLWLALRDIVLLWVGEGVRLFRVDNPHTKPLPFWEWMIAEVRAEHPDVVFLAEAFTRPKVMYRLAKIGFSQSYTYFTWRHDKQEFIDYLTELTQTAPKEFFRPHFFVNTPDINPYFLQRSGRGGFLIRAALASTLSGLWGVYSGFELLEAEPLPGREEYADSEKYEIRPRPERTPGDIVDEISRLNRIRKGHPALQTHLGVIFLPAGNDKVLVYAKATASLDDVVVVAVSLDPHGEQETSFDLPLWSWGLPRDATIEVEDLIWEQRFSWTGEAQHVRLDPGQPYAIWSLRLPATIAA